MVEIVYVDCLFLTILTIAGYLFLVSVEQNGF